MFTVHDQIEHEKKHAELSSQRYYFKQDALRDSSRGDEVDATRSIMRKRIEEIGRTIEKLSSVKAGINGKYNRLLKEVATFDEEPDFNVLAYLGIQAIFQSLGRDHGNDWVVIATSIASRLEFEHKTRKFEEENPGYYHAVVASMEEQQVSSYKHKRKVLSKKMTDFDMEWNAWNNHTKIQIANKVLIAVMHNLDDVFFRTMRYHNGKTIAVIDTTTEADDWLATFEAEKGYLNPIRLPTLIKPLDWIKDDNSLITGGYYSHRLSQTLVKAYSQEHIEYLKDFDMFPHIEAINKLQATEWAINRRVFDVQHKMFADDLDQPGLPSITKIKIPEAPDSIKGIDKENMTEAQLGDLAEFKDMAKALSRADKSRKGRVIHFRLAFNVASMYKDYDKFHYVYTPDFRGRIYSDTTGLSPQGNDTSKALLQFANSKQVTKSGLFWLAVHGANTFGYDKVSYQDRVDWIYEKREMFERINANPIDRREDWASADKPWQFLAFVFEWARTEYGENPAVHTNIPVGLDGSCNGLQHYSALLRDSTGGRSVNLSNSDVPSDIYNDVSESLRKNLTGMGNEVHAKTWLKTGLGRKLTKRPVMTLPYGSTLTSCRAYIHEWALENEHKFPGMSQKEIYTACIWLTPHLWKAIGEVVVAARDGMDWLQSRVVHSVRDSKLAVTWTSPVDFPVYQPYMNQSGIEVETRTSGGIYLPRISVSMQEDTKIVSRTKQRSGIAPNFVHSLDSSHMVMVINNTDFKDYAMIHDDFGTHAADTGFLWTAIREQFVNMYKDSDILRSWSDQQPGKFTGEYPDTGDLDIDDVLTSEYFFG